MILVRFTTKFKPAQTVFKVKSKEKSKACVKAEEGNVEGSKQQVKVGLLYVCVFFFVVFPIHSLYTLTDSSI